LQPAIRNSEKIPTERKKPFQSLAVCTTCARIVSRALTLRTQRTMGAPFRDSAPKTSPAIEALSLKHNYITTIQIKYQGKSTVFWISSLAKEETHFGQTILSPLIYANFR